MRGKTIAFALLLGLAGCITIETTPLPPPPAPGTVIAKQGPPAQPTGAQPGQGPVAQAPAPPAGVSTWAVGSPYGVRSGDSAGPLTALPQQPPAPQMPFAVTPPAALQPPAPPVQTVSVPRAADGPKVFLAEPGPADMLPDRPFNYRNSSDGPGSIVLATKNELPLAPVPQSGSAESPRPLHMPPAPLVGAAGLAPVPEGPEPISSQKNAPMVRLVNTKRITLNFEVQDVGPSGVAGVEIWYTQDRKEWRKHDAPFNGGKYYLTVEQEGVYGFTLRARSGVGLAQAPPAPGDYPQVWVIVDLTRPNVQLQEVTPRTQRGEQSVTIRWSASDKYFGQQPITLSYAEHESGPWLPIAAHLENSGQYVWPVPPHAPARLLVRVEATDLAGNVGYSQVGRPVTIDNSQPRINITNVESDGR